jgi:hypothetical protein
LNGVTWPRDYEGTGSVVFRHEPEGGDATGGLTIDMAIKVREPLLQDSREYVTLSTPTLGRPQAARNPEPISLRVVEPEQGAAPDPRLVKLLGNQRWYEPEDVQVQFEAPLNGVRQEAGTSPIAPFRTEWRAKDRVKVDASISRPGEDAKNERRIFFAGVLVSLAASFCVWALELLLGPGRDPVAAPRRRP